ncbi:MAG TPA: hypothetical protein VIH64_09555, partial [Streptosporangiaceae bacterium]
LADTIERVAARGARSSGAGSSGAGSPGAGSPGAADDLPYPSAPALDLYAEAHAREEVRLFAS